MGYETVKTNPAVSRIVQKNTATCWLAACKMLYAWKGKDTGEVDRLLIEASKTDERVDYEYWCSSGIGQDDLVPLARTLGFKWGAGGKLELEQMVKAIQSWGPLLAVGAWNTNSHVIVVWGAENVTDKKYESTAKLTIANPWPNADDPDIKNMNWFNGGLGNWEGVNGQYMHW